jgi:ubiquinone/menaquinone biosynthesis C-methylase UbiE
LADGAYLHGQRDPQYQDNGDVPGWCIHTDGSIFLFKMKIEAIPDFVSGAYAFIARKSGLMREIRSRVADEVVAKVASGKILDVGTGPGYLPFEIARKAPALEVVGIDLSAGMVELARKTAVKTGLGQRVSFQTANASALPFKDKTFDLVVSTLSLHHWTTPAADFKEISRVLKDSGTAYIYDFRKDLPDSVRRDILGKYGWFLGHVFIRIARLHSWKTKQDAESFLAALDVNLSRKAVQEQGPIIRIELRK